MPEVIETERCEVCGREIPPNATAHVVGMAVMCWDCRKRHEAANSPTTVALAGEEGEIPPAIPLRTRKEYAGLLASARAVGSMGLLLRFLSIAGALISVMLIVLSLADANRGITASPFMSLFQSISLFCFSYFLSLAGNAGEALRDIALKTQKEIP